MRPDPSACSHAPPHSTLSPSLALQKQKSRDIIRSCNLNLAAAYLKLGKARDAAKAATEVRARLHSTHHH